MERWGAGDFSPNGVHSTFRQEHSALVRSGCSSRPSRFAWTERLSVGEKQPNGSRRPFPQAHSRAVACGSTFHSLAIRSDGTLAALGIRDTYGQLDVPTVKLQGVLLQGRLTNVSGSNGRGPSLRGEITARVQTDRAFRGTFVAVAAGISDTSWRSDHRRDRFAGWGGNTWGPDRCAWRHVYGRLPRKKTTPGLFETDGDSRRLGRQFLRTTRLQRGRFRAIAAERVFSASVFERMSTARTDLNGDGKSDNLWRNTNGLVPRPG
jgi:hypothetical protein